MALLETRALKSFYGDFQALYGIDTMLEESETVAIIGANGAGKSTYLKSIAGLIRNEPGMVMFDGQPIGAMPAASVMKLGISLVPEGRRLFPSLTVEENLLIGRYGRQTPGQWTLEEIYRLFPVLHERRKAASTTLSRWPAADGGDRPRADFQSARASVRRDQPRARADRHPRHLRSVAAHQGERHQRDRRRAGHRAGVCRSPTGSIASRRAACHSPADHANCRASRSTTPISDRDGTR